MQKQLIEVCEHCVEVYDILGYLKPSGHVHFVVLHFEHVLEWMEKFDP